MYRQITRGKPRDPASYRSWRRNNAISWTGVETKRKEHPPLEKRISKRGEVSYVRFQQRETV